MFGFVMNIMGWLVGAAYMPPAAAVPCGITGKPHGTQLCVPYKPAEKGDVLVLMGYYTFHRPRTSFFR